MLASGGWRGTWRGVLAAVLVCGLVGTGAGAEAAGTAPPPAAEVGVLLAARAIAGLPRVDGQRPAETIALETQSPEVQWSATGAIRWQSVPVRQAVQVGDRVRTGANAAARLVYAEGVVTEIGAQTGLRVERLERAPDGSLVARLLQTVGSTINRIGQAAGVSVRFEVETPAAIAAVEGTTPQLIVERDGRTRVFNVVDGTGGRVTVRAKDAAGSVITLAPGETTTVQPGQPPSAPQRYTEALPAAEPAPAVQQECRGQLRAEFFAGEALAGPPLLVRCDTAIQFEWGEGPPAPGLPIDQFSVRWRGQLDFPSDGEYDFRVTVDDGVRLYLDDRLLIDEWRGAPSLTYTARPFVTRGTHTLVVEYFEGSERASIRVDLPAPLR